MTILRKRFTRVWVVALLAITPCLASAEELASEQDLFADFSVTSATRLAQSPRDLPVSVTVIDRDMIEAMGVTEIAEVFRLVAGFRVGRVSGGMYSVAGHGAADQYSRRLEVLIDGRPIQSPVLNIVDWNAIPIELDDIDHIEVMRGSSVAVYGSNAFDGAINIITHKPFETSGVYARVLKGEPDVTSSYFRYGFSGLNADHSLSITEKRGEGFDDVHDGHRYTKLRYRGDFNPSVRDAFDVQFGISHGYLEEEGDGITVKLRPRKTDIDYQYINWRHTYDDGDDFVLKLYRNSVRYDDEYLTENISTIFGIPPAWVPLIFGGVADQPLRFGFYKGRSSRYGMDFQRSFNYPDIRVVAGAGLYHDRIDSQILFGDDGKSRDLNKQLFASMEWRAADNITVNAGVMVEDTNGAKPTISPRLALNYHFDEHNTFRVSVARSHRASSSYGKDLFLGSYYAEEGSLFDVLFDNRGYDKPQKITSYELGHLFTLPSSSLSVDWKLYYDKYDDTFVNLRDDFYVDELGNGSWIAANGGSYYAKGMDLQLKYAPSPKTLFALQYSYAKTGGKLLDDLFPVIDYEEFDDAMPRNTLSALLSHKFPHDWQASLMYSYVGEMEWRGIGDDIDRYDRLDARLAKDVRFGTTKLKLELIGHNLLNDHQEFLEGNIFDRRVLFRVSLTGR